MEKNTLSFLAVSLQTAMAFFLHHYGRIIKPTMFELDPGLTDDDAELQQLWHGDSELQARLQHWESMVGVALKFCYSDSCTFKHYAYDATLSEPCAREVPLQPGELSGSHVLLEARHFVVISCRRQVMWSLGCFQLPRRKNSQKVWMVLARDGEYWAEPATQAVRVMSAGNS